MERKSIIKSLFLVAPLILLSACGGNTNPADLTEIVVSKVKKQGYDNVMVVEQSAYESYGVKKVVAGSKTDYKTYTSSVEAYICDTDANAKKLHEILNFSIGHLSSDAKYTFELMLESPVVYYYTTIYMS